jgi:hypothetical protein
MNTLAPAVIALHRAGRDIDDAVLAHMWPTHHENIHFCGAHSVDVDGELAKLGSDGYQLSVPGPNAVTGKAALSPGELETLRQLLQRAAGN